MRDSAQFNSHLGKLTDQFVRNVQAVLAGSFTQHPERAIDIDDPWVGHARGMTIRPSGPVRAGHFVPLPDYLRRG